MSERTRTEQFLIFEAQEKIAELEDRGFAVRLIRKGPLVDYNFKQKRTLLVVFNAPSTVEAEAVLRSVEEGET